MNEKMDLEEHYPQNTISHCIISNENQITLQFFQDRISAMPEISFRGDLFWNVFVNIVIFKRFTVLVPSWPRFEKG